MAIINKKANTNGQRGAKRSNRSQLTSSAQSEKSLLVSKHQRAGRSKGTIRVRHRGGGAKRHYRIVDFNGADKLGIPGKITQIEHDPNRNAFIALVVFVDGEKRYQIAHKEAKVGDQIVTDAKAKPVAGNRMHLSSIPVGFQIFNVEITPNKGGQVVRAAGQSATLVSLDGDKAQVQMPSGEIRYVEKTNFATIGIVSNEEYAFERLGKAGTKRHKGRRPVVRGKAMNPVDHPHGGGEGGSPIGMKYPKTKWGAHALGVKTRKRKASDKLIAVTRHRAKKK